MWCSDWCFGGKNESKEKQQQQGIFAKVASPSTASMPEQAQPTSFLPNPFTQTPTDTFLNDVLFAMQSFEPSSRGFMNDTPSFRPSSQDVSSCLSQFNSGTDDAVPNSSSCLVAADDYGSHQMSLMEALRAGPALRKSKRVLTRPAVPSLDLAPVTCDVAKDLDFLDPTAAANNRYAAHLKRQARLSARSLRRAVTAGPLRHSTKPVKFPRPCSPSFSPLVSDRSWVIVGGASEPVSGKCCYHVSERDMKRF